MRDGVLRDLDGVDLPHLKDGHARSVADDLQLLDGGGTVDVARGQQRPVAQIFQHKGELCAVSGLTRALETAHHDDRRRVICDGKMRFRAAHKSRQLLVDDLDDHLRRSEAFHDLCADGALGHGLREVLGNFVVYVRLQESKTHLAHGFLDVAFGQRSL